MSTDAEPSRLSTFPHDFARATAITPAGERAFDAHVPDGWQQGRGAFGGLVLAILARALERTETDSARTLRAFSGEIVGPVLPGAAAVDVELLRRGNGTTALSARLRQGSEVLARASAFFGKERNETRDFTRLTAPAPLPFDSVAPDPLGPFAPAFLQHYDVRSTGPLPFSGAPEAVASGWVRPRTPPARVGYADIIAYADAWWPSVFSTEAKPRPMATVAFTLEPTLDPATLDPEAPLFHRAHAIAAHGGYIVELRELWTAEGRLVALNQQTFVVIK